MNFLRRLGLVTEHEFTLSSSSISNEEGGFRYRYRPDYNGKWGYGVEYQHGFKYANLFDSTGDQYIMALSYPKDLETAGRFKWPKGQQIRYTRYFRSIVTYTMGDYSGVGITWPKPNDILIGTGILVLSLSGYAFIRG